ncbi:hypothetical protein ACE40V_24640, partial [Salmonella enterica]|uniref:hypothetical protein n=1 Tax=Salmonella enterica TaxID=28901 RepID=UPI003D2B2B7B
MTSEEEESEPTKVMDFRKKSTNRLFFTPEEVDLIATALQLLSHTPSVHEAMVKGEVMAIFRSLIFADISEK